MEKISSHCQPVGGNGDNNLPIQRQSLPEMCM